ncbi:phospholipase A2 inhibitor and Ly6/PLAUR domain-containing protein-like [Elgaria multicarinata webbii]|uniref:phospholipase A2 inhibitor and Ly6/PLAUR domain-containing protein-like n=1 Tax=Elgaria multicarinata webbii TaxID=159646 RepID=UPI002FCD5303
MHVLGWSRQCEICTTSSSTCTGPLQTCIPGLDACATIQTETIARQPRIAKMCKSASDCYENHTIVNMGKGVTLSSKLSCCTGWNCRHPLPALPSVNMTLNGKKCKGCIASESIICRVEGIVSCAGDQNHCVEVHGLGFFEYPNTVQDPD